MMTGVDDKGGAGGRTRSERVTDPALKAALGWMVWINRAKLAGALLVAIGVVMEFVAEFAGRPYERTIEKAHESELSRLNNDTKRLSAEAEAARSAIAASDAKAAEANRTAEEEKLKRVRLEQRIAPRAITAEQRERMTAALRPFAGLQIALTSVAGDQEALPLFEQLRGVLESAGWEVKLIMNFNPTASGLLVELVTGADQRTEEAAIALITALNREDLAAVGPRALGLGNPTHYIHLTVGRKP